MGIMVQEYNLNQYCQEHGLTVASTYVDDGFSGNTDKREGYRKLTKDIGRGKSDMVLTTSVVRLARDNKLLLQTFDRMEKFVCRVVATKDGLDSQEKSFLFKLQRFLARWW